MNNTFFKSIGISVLLAITFQAKAENNKGTTIDSLNREYLNWYNLDFKDNKVMGVTVDKSYSEILKNLSTKKTIVVAVIDGGVDIEHEDLKGKIWINEDEIPGNGIDDDKNGYVDDVNGWNFLGNVNGDNIKYENLEFVRIVNQYTSLFDTLELKDVADGDIEKYELFKKCNDRYQKEISHLFGSKERTLKLLHKVDSMLKLMESYTNTLDPNYKQLKAIKPHSKNDKKTKGKLLKLFKYGASPKSINRYLKYLKEREEYYLNIDLNARNIIGDNRNDMNDAYYGNNQVGGPSAEHGTFVAGLIAANRNNNIGINGIASDVKIMTLRTVPDGDEDDKDVALSIKYAVDNGAHIINMSFGKEYSPNKHMVDEAIKYAEEKGVLLVKAAGNSSTNNDTTRYFPDFELSSGVKVVNGLNIGASAKEAGKELSGSFSNYGKATVDLFAPGVNIISLYPNSKYKMANGTSFASPIVSGVAALVWSYYPELSVTELREVIVKSTLSYTKKVNVPGKYSGKKQKDNFSNLSVTGGIVNAYKALEMAAEKVKGLN